MVAVAMATREMAIAPPNFNREIKNFAKNLDHCAYNHFTPTFRIFFWFKQKIMKITNFHIFSQKSLLFRGK